MPNRAGKSYPQATYAFSVATPSLFASLSQPTGTPRPYQWLLVGVQACRLPAPKPLQPLKPLKPLQPLKPLKPLKPFKLCKSVSEWPTAQAKATPKPHTLFPSQRRPCSPGFRSQQAPQGHINGFLWASKPAVCQPLNPYNP